MMNDLRNNLMFENRSWNRRGTPIPSWFRRRLKAIDPSLVLQYLPPRKETDHPDEGVDRRLFPEGCWVVARRLPRSKMLFKKWVSMLATPGGGVRKPSHTTLKMIKLGRNLWRNSKLDGLTLRLDRAISHFNRTTQQKSRQDMAECIASTCRELSITKRSIGLKGGGAVSGPTVTNRWG